ncbi:hypothetical protein D3C85_1157040 [compost metagenome]
MLHVGGQGVLDRADAALVHRGVTPGVVGEVGVDRHADHFHAASLEFRNAVVQGDQLGRAHEGEVERVEEHQAVFAFDGLGQGEAVNDLAIAQNGSDGEVRSLLAYEYAHSMSPVVMGKSVGVRGHSMAGRCGGAVTPASARADHHTLGPTTAHFAFDSQVSLGE